jgi:hypothetical protein
MTNIVVSPRIAERFGAGIGEYLRILQEIALLPPDAPLCFDFRRCVFLTPFALLPLVLLMQRQAKQRQVHHKLPPGAGGVGAYLKHIFFPEGLSPEALMQTQGSYDLDRYVVKTYIPVTNFPAQRTAAATHQRDKFFGCHQ